MEPGKNSSWCSIVPEFVLHSIAQSEEESLEVREAAKNTIEDGNKLFKESVISNNITGTTDRKTISVILNGKLQPALSFEPFVWNANGGYDLRGKVWSQNSVKVKENLRSIYNFFGNVFNWKLFDNKGNQVHVTIGYGQQCMNAYWNGSQVILGSGSQSSYTGQSWRELKRTENSPAPIPGFSEWKLTESEPTDSECAKKSHNARVYFDEAADVLAHELTHGIISQTSGLQYRGEPGALNEHLADVFGVLYQQYTSRYNWNGPDNQGQKDWSIGRHMFQFGIHSDWPVPPAEPNDSNIAPLGLKSARVLRYLQDPRKTWPPQAVRYPRPPRKLAELKYDNGGVHYYSGIPNLAFYTAAMNAGGNPWSGVGQVWFRAMTDPRLQPNSNFAHFAALTVDWAGRKYPELKDAIAKGWDKVDVEPLLSADCAKLSSSTKSVEVWKPAEAVGPLPVGKNVDFGATNSNQSRWWGIDSRESVDSCPPFRAGSDADESDWYDFEGH